MAWRLLAALGALVVLAAAAFGVWVIATLGSVSFPRDGAARGPIYANSVYASVRDVADTSGTAAGCRWVGVAPPRFRCVIPGRGDGALRYRVTVSRASGCWHARGVGFAPLHGCLPTRAASPSD